MGSFTATGYKGEVILRRLTEICFIQIIQYTPDQPKGTEASIRVSLGGAAIINQSVRPLDLIHGISL